MFYNYENIAHNHQYYNNTWIIHGQFVTFIGCINILGTGYHFRSVCPFETKALLD